jgi:hypothetical protein
MMKHRKFELFYRKNQALFLWGTTTLNFMDANVTATQETPVIPIIELQNISRRNSPALPPQRPLHAESESIHLPSNRSLTSVARASGQAPHSTVKPQMDIVGCCLSKAEGNISDQIKKKRNRMSKHMLLAAGQEAKVKDFF